MVELTGFERRVMRSLISLSKAEEPNYLKAASNWDKPNGSDDVRRVVFNACGADPLMGDQVPYDLFLSACRKLNVEADDLAGAVARCQSDEVDLSGPAPQVTEWEHNAGVMAAGG